MSVLSEYEDRVNILLEGIGTSVDGVVASLNGIDGDVQNLKKQITDLQNSPGAITPEDQARLDRIEAALNTLAAKTSAAAQAGQALDAQTENVPTPNP